MRTNVFLFAVLFTFFSIAASPEVSSHADTTVIKSVPADTQSLDDEPAYAMDSGGGSEEDTSHAASLFSSKNADSLSADSVKKNQRRDSLTAEKAKAIACYSSFPTGLDTLYQPIALKRQAIFSSDALTLSELARRFPQMVAAPLSLSNNLNRVMIYGFPLPAPLMDDGGIGIFKAADALTGTDRVSSAQVAAVSLDPLMRLRLTPHLDDVVAPETDFLWENGVFFENILNLRFVRPLSSDLSFGIFSNNRYFKAENYSTKNDIKSLYGYFLTDTNLLSQGGKNPLVEDQNTQVRFSSKGKNGERRNLSVSYHDEKNEISYESLDSAGNKTLRWNRIFQYGTIADAAVEGMRFKPFFGDMQLHVESGGHSRYDPYTFLQRLGRRNEYSLLLRPYLPFLGDTAFVNASVTRHDQTLYDQSRQKIMREEASVAGAHHAVFGRMNASVSGSIGECFVSQNQHNVRKNDWIGTITAKIEAPHQILRAFAMRACTPIPNLYDSRDTAYTNALSSPYFDRYESYGAEYFGTYKKIGVMTGVCGFAGLDRWDSLGVWPSNALPYPQPRVSFVVSPLFGEWHGLSAASRWMFSDTKPFIKVQTSISYKAHPIGGREHILLDLVYDYWSVRDTFTYGGDRNWNREINNVSLNTAVQIKTFSLFYKIDNILNRKFAYVPGYYMPGITFRWGFQWLLQG